VVRAGAVDVLVILDGASEPLDEAPTSLERARTPVLDRLATQGTVTALRTVPRGLPVGSETAIPGLLGWVPRAALDRGAIEAAAHGIAVGERERAWRVDRRDRAHAAATAPALERLLAKRLPAPRPGVRGSRVHHLAGHRMLVVGPDAAPTLGAELLGIELRAGLLGAKLRVWPRGAIPPRVLGEDTVVIGARGAAIGIARLMGAATVVPPGATGRPGSDIAAKAAAALAAIDTGAARVVVHVGAPDEAAHELDAAAKVAAIETADALLLEPLAGALSVLGGTLRVCPDHGCDPATGSHDGLPVPCLDWPAPPSALASGARLTERTILGEPATVAA
jgi:2,3-bisphosphoglycerate-independent phosphoglycerate mutase